MQHEKADPRRHGRERERGVRGGRARRRRGDPRRGLARRRRRGGDRRERLLRAARADRQPHAHGHAVRRHALDRRLRHRHARRRRGRHDLHRRLRHPAGAGRAALLARGVAGPRRRRRARGLRLPHGDHERRRRHLRRHGADGRGGPLLVQGVPRLQGRADGHRRPVLPRARDHARPRRAHDGPLRERLGDRRARRARARGRPDGPDLSRVHAAGDPRGGGHLPLRAAGRARRRGRVHRARDLRDGRRRDRGGPAARRPRVRRDLPPVPDEHRRGPRSGPTSRAPATCARRRCARSGTRSCSGRRSGAGARERVHRPLPVQQRAEGARARRLLEDPERPGHDPAPAREAVGPGRGGRPDDAEPARGHDLDDDRAALRPRAQGIDRARVRRRPRRVRPVAPRSSSPRARRR